MITTKNSFPYWYNNGLGPKNVLTDGGTPKVWLTSDYDTSTILWTDRSTSLNTVIINSGVSRTLLHSSGAFGNKITLNGTNGFLEIPDNINIRPSVKVSTDTWFRKRPTQPSTVDIGSTIFQKGTCVDNCYGNIYTASIITNTSGIDDRIYFAGQGRTASEFGGFNYNITLATPLTSNIWHHLVTVQDTVSGSSTLGATVYLDGVQIFKDTYAWGATIGNYDTQPLLIGTRAINPRGFGDSFLIEKFPGDIASFILYDGAMAQSDVTYNYDNSPIKYIEKSIN